MTAADQVVQVQQWGQTLRYHTEVTLKTQDVAQHSFNVAWLCWVLTEGQPSAALLLNALAHDAGERSTGDLPAPVKRADPGLGAILDRMEDVHMAKAGFSRPPLTAEEAWTLKLADILDGAFFCLREVMLGNRLMLSRVRGGAGVNFLSYLGDYLHAPHPHNTTHGLGFQLYDYLMEQYATYIPTDRS